MNDERLLEVRASWWNFFWHIAFAWLIIPLVVALWKRASLVFRVYEDRIVLERGVLSKEIKEIFITDIRTIDVRQSFIQRIFNIGDLMIATSGTSGYESIAYGLPDPKGIKDVIIAQRRSK
ncbi:MAG: PH domain-containing protein [Candidatus Hydrothermarchaeota archaeon]